MTGSPSITDLALCGLGAGYVGAHFVLYAVAGRHAAGRRTERGIFAWHALSFLFQPILLAWVGLHWQLPGLLPSLAFAAALHGLYSLSFLELWSLTQGSYSLGILAQLHQMGGEAAPDKLTGLRMIGQDKRSSRRADLSRLGLIRPDGTLTASGRLAALPLRAIVWLSHGRTMN